MTVIEQLVQKNLTLNGIRPFKMETFRRFHTLRDKCPVRSVPEEALLYDNRILKLKAV